MIASIAAAGATESPVACPAKDRTWVRVSSAVRPALHEEIRALIVDVGLAGLPLDLTAVEIRVRCRLAAVRRWPWARVGCTGIAYGGVPLWVPPAGAPSVVAR